MVLCQKNTTGALIALRMLTKKYREGKRAALRVYGLGFECGSVRGKELWFRVKKVEMTEKHLV